MNLLFPWHGFSKLPGMPHTKRILIIDDEQDFCNLVVLMLHREPFHVVCAHNLNEARQFLHDSRPDLVLLDNNLPDGSGLEFFKESRSQFNLAKTVLMTADPSPNIRSEALDIGLGFLAKPFGLKKIREVIRSVA